MALKVFFAIAAYFDLNTNQIDVKMAFLYSFIDQLIYVKLTKGTEIKNTRNMVCKLLKLVYGLKQLPHLLYEQCLSFFLKKLGLSYININHNSFVLAPWA